MVRIHPVSAGLAASEDSRTSLTATAAALRVEVPLRVSCDHFRQRRLSRSGGRRK